MKSPELSVMYSKTIGAELLVEQLALVPDGNNLTALAGRYTKKVIKFTARVFV